MNPIISIVVPVYNSAGCLQELALRISENLRELPYELILVNDCSRDNSWNEIASICSQYKNITGISLRKNTGQDNAIMAGLRFVKGEYVTIMDDDLQHDPKDILLLYQKCSEGYDVCYAMFTLKRQKLWKNLGSIINNKLSGINMSRPDGIRISPFKVFKADLVTEIIKYQGPFPYVDALLISLTNNITQIPITHHRRYKGSGNFNFNKSLAVFLNHLTTQSIYPLRLIVYLAMVMAFFTFILTLFELIRFLSGNQIHSTTLILLLVLFLGSSMLVCLGIIGEYIGRTFLTINQKPQYSVARIIISEE